MSFAIAILRYDSTYLEYMYRMDRRHEVTETFCMTNVAGVVLSSFN